KDANQCFLPCLFEQLVDVVSQAKTLNIDGDKLVCLDTVDQSAGFLLGLIAAVQVQPAAILRLDFDCWRAGSGRFKLIAVGSILQSFYLSGQLRLNRPERGEILQVRSILRQDKAQGWISACTHWREAVPRATKPV